MDGKLVGLETFSCAYVGVEFSHLQSCGTTRFRKFKIFSIAIFSTTNSIRIFPLSHDAESGMATENSRGN